MQLTHTVGYCGSIQDADCCTVDTSGFHVFVCFHAFAVAQVESSIASVKCDSLFRSNVGNARADLQTELMKRLVMRGFLLPLVVLTVLTVVQAGASVVTAIPGGTIYPLPGVNYYGQGPETFGPGITWSSNNTCVTTCSYFGYPGFYGFGLNGNWTGALGPMAGLNSSFDFSGVTDTMTFQFATPVYAVGGSLNYSSSLAGNSTPTTIAVWDSKGNLIESYDLTFTAPVDSNGNPIDNFAAFYGFVESSPNIASFTLTDNYIGITQFTVESPVPEPGSILLLGSGLLGLIGYGRRRLGL